MAVLDEPVEHCRPDAHCLVQLVLLRVCERATKPCLDLVDQGVAVVPAVGVADDARAVRLVCERAAGSSGRRRTVNAAPFID